MSKKKKKLDPSLFFFSPGAVSTHAPSGIPVITSRRPWWEFPAGPQTDLFTEGMMAWSEYTFGGSTAVMAAKATAQAGAFTALGIYPSFVYGLSAEIAMDLVIFTVGATLLDPSDRWRGGIDEFTDDYSEKHSTNLKTSGMWKHLKIGSVV